MFKKISCMIVAVVTVFVMSVSAFAVGDLPPKIDAGFEIIEINKDDFVSLFDSANKQLAVDVINKTNVSNGGLYCFTVVHSNNSVTVGIAFGDSPLVVKSQDFDKTGTTQHVRVYFSNAFKLLRFKVDVNGNVSEGTMLSGVSGDYVSGHYVNSNMSDTITKITSDYSYLDGTVKQIKFVSTDSGSTPIIPNNPNSTLDIPDGGEYVPYDTKSTLGDFFGTLSGNIGVATNVGLVILAIVVGIPLVIRIVKRFTKA